jgi:hypothetical protein
MTFRHITKIFIFALRFGQGTIPIEHGFRGCYRHCGCMTLVLIYVIGNFMGIFGMVFGIFLK